MNWFERNSHWVLLTLFVVLAYVTVGFLGVSALALLAGALGGASLGALLADAAIAAGLTGLLVAVEIVLAVAFVANVVRRLSFPTSDRLASLFSTLETLLPPLRDLALSRRFEPSLEEREAEIKRRYVDGELSERAFEREMRDLLADAESPGDPLDTVDQRDVAGERTAESSTTESLSGDVRSPDEHNEFERG